MDEKDNPQTWRWVGDIAAADLSDVRFKCLVEIDGAGASSLVRIWLFRNGRSWEGQGSETDMGAQVFTSDKDVSDDDVMLPAELSESYRAARVRKALEEILESENATDPDVDPNCGHGHACLNVQVDNNGCARAVVFSHTLALSNGSSGTEARYASGSDSLSVIFAVIPVELSSNPGAFLVYSSRRLNSAQIALKRVSAQRASLDRETDRLDKAVDLVKKSGDQDEKSIRLVYASAFRDELNGYKQTLADRAKEI